MRFIRKYFSLKAKRLKENLTFVSARFHDQGQSRKIDRADDYDYLLTNEKFFSKMKAKTVCVHFDLNRQSK
jgi:hypothetical protein